MFRNTFRCPHVFLQSLSSLGLLQGCFSLRARNALGASHAGIAGELCFIFPAPLLLIFTPPIKMFSQQHNNNKFYCLVPLSASWIKSSASALVSAEVFAAAPYLLIKPISADSPKTVSRIVITVTKTTCVCAAEQPLRSRASPVSPVREQR